MQPRRHLYFNPNSRNLAVETSDAVAIFSQSTYCISILILGIQPLRRQVVLSSRAGSSSISILILGIQPLRHHPLRSRRRCRPRTHFNPNSRNLAVETQKTAKTAISVRSDFNPNSRNLAVETFGGTASTATTRPPISILILGIQPLRRLTYGPGWTMQMTISILILGIQPLRQLTKTCGVGSQCGNISILILGIQPLRLCYCSSYVQSNFLISILILGIQPLRRWTEEIRGQPVTVTFQS